MLGLLLGCDPSAPPERVRYQQIISSTAAAAEDMPRCLQLPSADLAGDCALSVASRPGQPPGALCGQVPAGVWQEECWFVAAEAINRRGDAEGAARLCLRAGRFSLDCAQHLWQTPVHRLIHDRGAAAFVDLLPDAQALYSAWAPLMVERTDFAERFWAKFYGNGFEGQGTPVDLGWCAELPAEHRRRCRAAGVAHYAREIGPHVEQAGALLEMCALPAADVQALAPWIAAAADPALDAIAAQRVVEICTTHPALR